MFKHLLLCADGSDRSDRAIARGINLAHAVDARITFLHVIPTLDERMTVMQEAQPNSERGISHQYLSRLEELATQADVLCDTLTVESDHSFRAIVETAAQRNCDLIVMTSHGRKGIHALLPGGETHDKVLAHTDVDVLVVHPGATKK